MVFGIPCQTLNYILVIFCVLFPFQGHSFADPSALCRDAAAKAAVETGVPYDVLIAIATVETGRDDQPWPWTVNFAGDGHWYESAEEAAESINQAVRDGVTNLDVGCFQLNYRWHGSAFSSVGEMLDPVQNAAYAAEFLSRHHANTGDWALAAAAYHSATPEYAKAYQTKFQATFDRLAGDPDQIAEVTYERRNGFPLLVAGKSGMNGSLFSSASVGRPLIGGP